MNEIEKAKQFVKEKQEDLQRERDLHMTKPNEKMAEDTPEFISSYDFWCDNCEIDFSQVAYKTVHRIYGDPVVCYRTRHECGEECIRLLSHRDHDQYYQKSEKIRYQRHKYEADMLRADEYGFRALYGNPYREFEEDMQKEEERLIQLERDKGLKGQSLKTQEFLNRIYNV